MTLDEAMTDLECLAQSEIAGLDDDEREAIGLGIQALKAVKDVRANNYYTPIPPLPSETEE